VNDANTADLLLLAEVEKLTQGGFGLGDGHAVQVEFGFQVDFAGAEFGEQFVLNAGAAVFKVFLIADGVRGEHIGEGLTGHFMLNSAFTAGFDFGFGALDKLAVVTNRGGIAHFFTKQRKVIFVLFFLPVSHERDKT